MSKKLIPALAALIFLCLTGLGLAAEPVKIGMITHLVHQSRILGRGYP